MPEVISCESTSLKKGTDMNAIKVVQAFLVYAMTVAVGAAGARAAEQEMKSTPRDLVDALHSAFGKHPNARAVHAKGLIFEGTFTPSTEAATLTTAMHLQKTNSKVVVRLSNFTGIPDIPDNIPPANPRGFAIRFIMPDGKMTDIVGHSFSGFPVSNSDEFREFLLSVAKSGPDAVKPTALDNYLETHPIAKTFLTTQHTPASYASISYFGVNAFQFTNQKGEEHFVRYQFIPADGEKLISPEQMAKETPDYLQKEIKARIAKGPIRFQMYAQIAESGDVIDNPSVAWPDARKRVMLGTIEIQKLGANTPEEDKKLSFLPSRLPAGILPADPMIDFRSQAYPLSVQERQ
jgi:catalase